MKPLHLALMAWLCLFSSALVCGNSFQPDTVDQKFFQEKVNSGLYIEGGRKFKIKVLKHLQRITNYKLDIQLLSGKVVIYGISYDGCRKPLGNEILKQLIFSDKVTRIKYSRDGENEFIPTSLTRMIMGKPMGGTVHYNPRTRKGGENVRGKTRRPPFIGLAHELIHAYHSILGVAQMGAMNEQCVEYKNKITVEEHNTRIKENVIREEAKIPARKIPLTLECYHDKKSLQLMKQYFQQNCTVY